MTGPERISPEEARTRSLQLWRAYLGMLAIVQANVTDWQGVADVLDEAVREARDRARVNRELGR